jgi:hypothetical protein
MKVQKTVEIESAGYDLVSHSAKLYAAIKKAGGFTAAAIPLEVAAVLAEAPALVDACQHLKGDLAEDKVEFIKGANLGAYELLDAVKG